MADFVACPGCGEAIVFPESCDQCFEQFCGGQCRDYHTCKAEEVKVADDDIDYIDNLINGTFVISETIGDPARVAAAREKGLAAWHRIRERLKDPCVHESAIVQNALDAQGDAETEMMWLRLQLDMATAYLDAYEVYARAIEVLEVSPETTLPAVESTYKALDWANRPRCTYSDIDHGLCNRVIREGDRCRTHREMDAAASRVPDVADAPAPDDGLSPAPWTAREVVADDGVCGSVTMVARDGRRSTFFLPTPADARFVAEARNRLAKHRGGQ